MFFLAFKSALLRRPRYIFVLNKITAQENKAFSYPLHTHTHASVQSCTCSSFKSGLLLIPTMLLFIKGFFYSVWTHLEESFLKIKNIIRVHMKPKLSFVFPLLSWLKAGNYLWKLPLGNIWNRLAETTVLWNMGETSFIVPSGVKNKVKVGNSPCSFVLFSAMFKKFVWLKCKKLTCYKIYFS